MSESEAGGPSGETGAMPEGAWPGHGRGNGADPAKGPARQAPGGPGDEPRWASSSKIGVGTALTPTTEATSLVWFTLARGAVTEVFYPRIDRACLRGLALLVSDGRSFAADERDESLHTHETAWVEDGVPAFRLINTCKAGRYRIEKTVLGSPGQDAVLMRVRFVPLAGSLTDYHLYAVAEPHLDNRGAGNTGRVTEHKGVPMLTARRGNSALALACSAPWLGRSAGFVGASDGRSDILKHKRMTAFYDAAEDGNVALTGEVDLAACGGAFILALGFGPDVHEAAHRARASLQDDFDDLLGRHAEIWRDWLATLDPPRRPEPEPQPTRGPAGRDLFRTSAAVVRVHDTEAIPGAVIASLSNPWGEVRGDETPEGTGGYHLVWPRDLVENAGGLIAAGATREAVHIFDYLRATQEADGHWPQNMWVNSARYWDGVQLGETALPVLLADRLCRDGAIDARRRARVWETVRAAAGYLVRRGPSTQEDRWENQRGYTPFTIAVVVSALLAAADLADACDEPGVGRFLRETADGWNGCVESWLYVVDTPLARRLGVEGYYVRSLPPELADASAPGLGHVRLAGEVPVHKGRPVTEIVSPDALALVRFGLRAADDPRILNTVKAIDATLKTETPYGPSWHRYNGDGYGEHADGSPYTFGTKTRGVGRLWPLLTAERAHYELAAGRPDEAARLLHAVERFANDAGLIPEQVWDTDDLPERRLFLGRATGSAMPLVWAHAEYLTLRRSLHDGAVADRPPQPYRRYVEEKTGPGPVVWRHDHRRRVVCEGESLRVELPEPAAVAWSADGGGSTRRVLTLDSGLGLHYADLPTSTLPAGTTFAFTIIPPDGSGGTSEQFSVTIEPRGGAKRG